MNFKIYLQKAFRWDKGRQGTGYDKMLLITSYCPIPFDSYIIRYPEGSEIPPHIDSVQSGKHYRLNIVIKDCKQGGEFICKNLIFETKRIKFFRPDISEHSVSKVIKGNRYIFSIGWILS